MFYFFYVRREGWRPKIPCDPSIASVKLYCALLIISAARTSPLSSFFCVCVCLEVLIISTLKSGGWMNLSNFRSYVECLVFYIDMYSLRLLIPVILFFSLVIYTSTT